MIKQLRWHVHRNYNVITLALVVRTLLAYDELQSFKDMWIGATRDSWLCVIAVKVTNDIVYR